MTLMTSDSICTIAQIDAVVVSLAQFDRKHFCFFLNILKLFKAIFMWFIFYKQSFFDHKMLCEVKKMLLSFCLDDLKYPS